MQDKITRNKLLARVRRHGIYARQVCDLRIRVALYCAVLTLHGNAGKVADVLIGARKSVKKRGFAAVLVAHQRKGQYLVLRQRCFLRLVVIPAFLAQTGMFRAFYGFLLFFAHLRHGFFNFYFLRIGKTQCQLVAVYAKLHRVAHGCQLDHGHFRPGYNAHIQKMLP